MAVSNQTIVNECKMKVRVGFGINLVRLEQRIVRRRVVGCELSGRKCRVVKCSERAARGLIGRMVIGGMDWWRLGYLLNE